MANNSRLHSNITKRTRRRRQRNGAVIVQVRYVLNYRDPRTDKRHQLFFERHKNALERRDQLVTDHRDGCVVSERNIRSLTVGDAVERWLANREGEITARTMRGYREAAKYLTEPVLIGTAQDRFAYSTAVEKPTGARFLPILGDTKLSDLNTSDIRAWHKGLWTEVGAYTANRAKMFLKTALALAAEDFNIRTPTMPALLGRGRVKAKKTLLSSDQVVALIKAARADLEWGIYYAFPFLTGVRPCELLGLLWDDIDFEASVIRVRRSQGDKGELLDVTKTNAGMRDVPMGPQLKAWLLEWRVRCPRRAGELHRVFPGPGRIKAWPRKRVGGGGPLTYQNFRKRVWNLGLERAGVPHVTPHSARHFFVSTLQAQGVEVGLVAKLAGHANPNVTLGHYTQAVRGGAEAINALDLAFGA